MATQTSFSHGLIHERNKFPKDVYSESLREFIYRNIFPENSKQEIDDAESLTYKAFLLKESEQQVGEECVQV